ncbi:hypothetical protein AQUCO_02900034v1 [Aquilegia coerulea]|uniref:Uncharacterized protein n=1 Tax=Aquilegia coerulea TaxID=218851 RepID=A0A2G5D307_AQUCA|nr:hypothetical protein AQUCO_02900034v1 [Aquilegia coerulea]
MNHILLSLASFDAFLCCNFFEWVECIPDYKHTLQPSWTMIHILTRQKQFYVNWVLCTFQFVCQEQRVSIHLHVNKIGLPC